MPVSTAFRQLRFLVKQGYLANRDGVYTLGNAMMRLGYAARRQNPLSRIAHPLLAALSTATRETVHLAELRDQQIVYVDKVEGSRPMRMGSLNRQQAARCIVPVSEKANSWRTCRKRNAGIARRASV